jgi:DNA (cytosine-5)-methyltransferase 1
MVRIVRQLRPSYVVVENTPGLLDKGRGFGHLLGSLARIGYDAEWGCVPCSAFGAPHLRKRIFVVAYPMRERLEVTGEDRTEEGAAIRGGGDDTGLGAVRVLRGLHLHDPRDARSRLRVSPGRGLVHEPIPGSAAWETESPVCRVAYGVPKRVDRLTGLGNAVVPQVAEWIGRRIMEHAEATD